MTLAKRLALAFITVLVGLVAVVVGIVISFGYSFRDVLAHEVVDSRLVLRFWIDREAFEEGDPSLLFEVFGSNGEVLQSKLVLGSAFTWYPSEAIDLRTVEKDGVSAVVLGDFSRRPLAIWENDSVKFAPRVSSSESESEWLLGALYRLTAQEGSCLGYLSQGEIECR